MIEGSLNSDRSGIITSQKGAAEEDRGRRRDDGQRREWEKGRREKKKQAEAARKFNSHLFSPLQLRLLPPPLEMSPGDLTPR